MTTPTIEGFTSVRTSTLNAREPLLMDVFVPVGGRAVRYAALGDSIDEERFARLKKFRLVKVLIRAGDESRYRDFLDAVMKRAEDAKKPVEDRAASMSASSDAAGEQLVEKVEDADTYKRSFIQFEKFAAFLKAYEEALPMVLKSFRDAPERDHVSHGSFVGTLALAIAERADLLKEKDARPSLLAAAFLHDMPLERMGLPLRREGLYTPEQLEQWKAHPLKAADMFASMPHIGRLTLEIVAQHEEIPNGTGFPRGLHKKQMHPLSCVVGLANRFDHALIERPGVPGMDVLKEFKLANLGLYDLDQIDAMTAIIQKAGF